MSGRGEGFGAGLVRGWWRPAPGLAARLLSPAGWVVGRLARARMDRPPGARAPVPVLCVGNPTVGGAGKTPMALAIARLLEARGYAPAFLTRGYRGRLGGPVLVDPAAHAAADVGDEPLLLARAAPTVVAADRAAGADAIVMDDGFQNPALFKDWSCLVVDAAVGLGNGRVVPAGPLRAPAGPQLARADLLVLVDGGDGGRACEVPGLGAPLALPAVRARLAASDDGGLAGRRILAFAGIGRPEKFFATCRALGAEVVRARPFPDHHAYDAADARALLDAADAEGLLPVTTAKDAVRLPERPAQADDPLARLRARLAVVEVEARLSGDDINALAASIDRALARRLEA